jgi:IS30 family transposase
MKGKSQKRALLVITDRATLHTKMSKVENRNSNIVSKTMIKSLLKSSHQIHTITFDNDKGFADQMTIAKALNDDISFTRPYTSKDKGTVENNIGQIRRFFSKKTNHNMVNSD